MSKVYGAPSPGGFVAEMIGVMCSGDMERVKAFNAKMIRSMGEQLTLKLNAPLEAFATAEKAAKEPRKPALKVRKRGKR